MPMRDLVFLVADGAMVQMLHGFFGREQFHRALGCGSFEFDPEADIVHAPYKDHDVCGRARELLSPYERTHEHAVVLVDDAWDASKGPDWIRKRINQSLTGYWERYKVIVLEPELEAWLWQDNPHVGKALGCKDFREYLHRSGHWPRGQSKPTDPKAAFEYLGKRHRADKSNAVFRRMAGKVSVKNCEDDAFRLLRDTLQDWFGEDKL
ncbi:hypothetical protein GCM10029992_07730 [Glycomyces albus]